MFNWFEKSVMKESSKILVRRYYKEPLKPLKKICVAKQKVIAL